MLHQVYCKIDRISTTYFGISNSSAIGLFLDYTLIGKDRKNKMITTISEILANHQVQKIDTIYSESLNEMMQFQIVAGDFFQMKEQAGNKVICYKNKVYIMDFEQIRRQIPKFDRMRYLNRDEMPYFVAGLEQLQEALKQKRKIAIEGGPCLFGVGEVEVKITENSGSCYFFDYSIGRQNNKVQANDTRGENFVLYALERGKDIANIAFYDKKKGITTQEYDSIVYLFEAAHALDAQVVIPLPDMSYVKFLRAVLAEVDEDVREEAIKAFQQVAYRISDLYIVLIHKLGKVYKTVPYMIVHERESRLCEQYYTNRTPYIEQKRILKGLTKLPQKLEAIKDYISMPALPYYLFGITDILEIDCIDETDSYRKCQKAHKGVLNLSCMLYPERLSKDGINTIFGAEEPYKEYIM